MSDISHPLFETRAVSGDSNGLSAGPKAEIGSKVGILPGDRIQTLIHRKMIRSADELDKAQVQPASLDLRLGHVAYRVRASFLPGKESTVKAQLQYLRPDVLSLDEGAVLERGCVYVVPLLESLNLPESISAVANPKSSTGRLDVFTRLITNNSEVFDSVEPNYKGPLYAEISPRSFSIRVRKGSRLNQIRFRRRSSSQPATTAFRLGDKELEKLHKESPLTDGEATIRYGLNLRVNLKAQDRNRTIGYRAQRFTDIIDVDEVGRYRVEDYWDEIIARDDGRLILDPQQFYVLASKEALHIPPHLAAEMVPIDPTMGEFRVHYAGFFDPGFGHGPAGGAGSKAVLEVRSHEVPFILEDEQIIGRLAYEHLIEQPSQLYGGVASSYQGQGLQLSKHFK